MTDHLYIQHSVARQATNIRLLYGTHRFQCSCCFCTLTLDNFCPVDHDTTMSTCCHMYNELISWSAELYIDIDVCYGGAGLHKLNHHAASWRVQFRVLYWRCIVSSIRNPLDMGARILTSLWLGVFVGLVFLRLPSGTAWCACMTVTCYISPFHLL